MSAMKDLLIDEMELIDDNYKYLDDFYSFSLGMLAMTRILVERVNYSDENQVYLLKELQGVRDIWMETNRPNLH